MMNTVAEITSSSVAELGKHRVAYDIYGRAGPLIMLLHGIPGDRRSWAEVAAALSGHHRVLVPDLVGFGDSGDAPANAHAAFHAGVIRDLIERVAEPELHIVGFDFGGPIAVLASSMLGGAVKSLTLANTNVFPDTPIPLPLRIAKVRVVGDLTYRVFFGRAGLAAMWLAAVKDRNAYPASKYLRLLRCANTVRSTREVFLFSMRHLPELYAPVLDALQTLPHPKQVIWSDRDPFFPLAVGERTARAARTGRFLVFRGAGHFTPYERPGEFASTVADFVKSVSRGEG